MAIISSNLGTHDLTMWPIIEYLPARLYPRLGLMVSEAFLCWLEARLESTVRRIRTKLGMEIADIDLRITGVGGCIERIEAGFPREDTAVMWFRPLDEPERARQCLETMVYLKNMVTKACRERDDDLFLFMNRHFFLPSIQVYNQMGFDYTVKHRGFRSFGNKLLDHFDAICADPIINRGLRTLAFQLGYPDLSNDQQLNRRGNEIWFEGSKSGFMILKIATHYNLDQVQPSHLFETETTCLLHFCLLGLAHYVIDDAS